MTLDRYIIRQFLVNFGILLLVLMALFIVVDFIVDVDEFMQAGRAHRDDWYGSAMFATAAAIVGYYTPMALLIYTFFNGLLVVAAMGFTLSNLQRNRELTAVIASGVSLYRVAAPVLVAGVVLCGLTLPVQEFLLPPLAATLTRSKSQLKEPGKGLESKHLYYASAGGRDLLSAASFEVDGKTARLRGVRIVQRDPDRRTYQLVVADRAEWDDTQKQWDLLDVLAEAPPLPSEGRMQGERTRTATAAYATDLSPTVLLARRNANYANLLSIRSLEGLARNPAVEPTRRAKVTQIIWSRFSLTVLNVLVLVMGLPFFLKRLPGNMLVSSLRAAAVCIGAWGGGLILLQLPPGDLPVVAAWLPVVIYLPVAAVLLMSVKT